MDRCKGFLTCHVVGMILGACLLSCAPPLISEQEAQDRIYDHRSRAEVFRILKQPQSARIEREAAWRYQRLIDDGKTTTPAQALAWAAAHRERADHYQRIGYTRFVKAELDQAARYEDFALRAGGFTAATASGTAKEHRQRATSYQSEGFACLARHYEMQAEKLESFTPPLNASDERE